MSQAVPIAMLASLPEPVLSVYLDTNPLRHLNRNSEHGPSGWFSRQAKRLLTATDSSEQTGLAAAIRRVERFLKQTLPPEQGIALFAGAEVWQAVPLPNQPENELHWGKPMLWQLAAILHRHQPWCVVLVDWAGARLFSFQFGELIPLETLKFQIDPSHWKRMQAFHTGERQAGMAHGPQRDLFERRREANLFRLLGEAAQRVAHACADRGLHQVLLFGPSRYTRVVERALPPALRKQTFHVAHLWHDWHSSSSPAGILKEALWRFEADRQQRQVGELLKGGRAVVTGARQTFVMLQHGRLGHLVVEEGFNPMLGCCATCGYVSDSLTAECPRCHGGLEDRKLQELLPPLLVRHVCEGEFLSGEAAAHLRTVGSIGGWLRQKPRGTMREAVPQQQAWLTAGAQGG